MSLQIESLEDRSTPATLAPGLVIGQTAPSIDLDVNSPAAVAALANFNALINNGGPSTFRGFDTVPSTGPTNPLFNAREVRGDINGDGVDDVIRVSLNGPVVVEGYDGATGVKLGSFTVLAGHTNGASIALGDLNHDGHLDILVGSNTGLATVEAYDGTNLTSLGNFNPFGMYYGSVNVAVQDLNNDGVNDVLIGKAGAPSATGFSGNDLSNLGEFSLPPQFGGVYVG
jgi:hypothetical protein